jgi:lysophospholipase L1-like esterase
MTTRTPNPARAVRSAALAGVLAVALTACEEDPDIVRPAPPAGGAAELMRSYVALGNSITAGYQSGGINDSTQRQSYASLIANAAGTRYAYAALTMPGCAPPVANFQTQARVGGGSSTTCAFRTQASATAALNNVAVPGATVLDPIASTTASNALTTFILGGKTQVRRALDAAPSFVSIWIGNNDVLEAGVSGVLTPLANVSRGVTPLATFTGAYTAMLDTLTAGAPGLKGVLLGVVNVTSAPILFPAAALVTSAQFRAGFEQFTGGALTILPNCTATSRSLISFQIASAIRTFRTNPTAAGAHPPVISCEKGQFPLSALVGEVFVLDGAEIDAITAAVNGYNSFIQTQATARGFAYYDPNPALQALRANGSIPTVPNLADAANPFGTFISLDGVHPRRPAHVVVANGVIAAVNAKYSVSIPQAQ